CARDQSNMDVW
nr:immunoglobulin heavy chain junction region [Macaca mulatta]MOW98152.1 immunoglobulin heavy chain junction region [Macaca mulatta]MOW98432.1 immunoglobulin heavy chain junction region [Macaca mulatta]MOW98610.1 immunoglobulin heavy chain junction region [Macaca mulatta]MOW98723.1 immunoglobulin heavy chain junction region [Macaca mulatta]